MVRSLIGDPQIILFDDANANFDLKNDQRLVANDARMDEIYIAVYEMNAGFMTLTGREQVVKPQQLGAVLENVVQLDNSWMTVGNGWSVYSEQLLSIAGQCCSSNEINEAFSYPHARDIAYLALKEMSNKTLVSAEQVSPVYLRNNVAKKPQKQP